MCKTYMNKNAIEKHKGLAQIKSHWGSFGEDSDQKDVHYL